MGKILVTGGAGYIGSHVVKLLGQAGHDLVIFDNLSTGRRESVLFGELIVGDLKDTALLDQLFKDKKFEAVLHFAGSIVVPESVENPLAYYQNNTLNSYSLLKMCETHKVNKLIFSSTAAVYGLPETGKADEQTALNPMNPYGRSKLMTEMMLQDLHHARPEFNFVALRYFNVSGADIDGKIGQCFPGATHLIKVTCETALGKRPEISVFGQDYPTRDGTCIRDFIHVQDLAQAHVLALDFLMKNKQSHILNCGYGQGTTVNEVIAKVKEVSGVNFKVRMVPRRAGDPAEVVAISDKIKSVLGWTPQFNDLHLIVKTALEWEKKLGTALKK